MSLFYSCVYFANRSSFDQIREMHRSKNLSSEENIYLTKFQVVELDSSVTPAHVNILSCNESKKDATKARKLSAVAKINFYDIKHIALEI